MTSPVDLSNCRAFKKRAWMPLRHRSSAIVVGALSTLRAFFTKSIEMKFRDAKILFAFLCTFKGHTGLVGKTQSGGGGM